MNVDSDLIFVLGMVIGLLAIPALLSAFSESRAPRTAAVMVMISAGLIAIAVIQRPGGYSFGDAPQVFFRVVGDFVN